jgi:hypothetical protein
MTVDKDPLTQQRPGGAVTALSFALATATDGAHAASTEDKEKLLSSQKTTTDGHG